MFNSFFIGGFECSTHRRFDGKRVDVVAATRHDELVMQDYAELQAMNIAAAREGLRWHIIEEKPGEYNFSSLLPFVRAAEKHNIQILWDLFHYGFPDHVDVFEASFVRSFARLSNAFARFLNAETDVTAFICPINEMSFFSFAAGETGFFAPFQHRLGDALKVNLVRAVIAAIEEFWDVLPNTRILTVDPSIRVTAAADTPQQRRVAERDHESQFSAWEMLIGNLRSELNGNPDYLDIIGVNYYPYNQWQLGEPPGYPRLTVFQGEPDYLPFRELLIATYKRYQRPMFIAETGTEGEARPEWLAYVCEEVRAAMADGVPIHGICLYPILNHPGWDNDRHCYNGLWDYADERGRREIYEPLAAEIRRQQKLFAA